MRICFITGGTLGGFLEQYQAECKDEVDGEQAKTDLFLFGFGQKKKAVMNTT